MLSRDELLSRLHEIFSRYGYEGASMARIAAATGLGKASLYHHFPNGKAQMARAVLDHVAAWFESNLFRPLEAVTPPRQRLVAMIATLQEHYASGERACLPAMLALGEERQMFAGQIESLFSRWTAHLTQMLADAGLARDVAERRAHDGLARVLGAMLMSRTLGDVRPFALMAEDLPLLLFAGADRSNVWSTRGPRFPSAPVAVQAPAPARRPEAPLFAAITPLPSGR
jgi:AcrR family transcriptional regulator